MMIAMPAPIHTGIFFLGIDISEWLSLVTLIGVAYGFINKAYKNVLKQSSEGSEKMLESFERTNTQNTDRLEVQLSNLSSEIKRQNDLFDNLQLREQEHYTEHEKHLVKHDIGLQQHSDTLDDHENRIKNNEDDIDHLKDELIQQKKASGNS